MDIWYFWLIVIALLILIEYFTVDLSTIWFVASSIVSLSLAVFEVDFIWQLLVFLFLGVILLITTRAFLIKKIHQRRINSPKMIGKVGKVIKKISPDKMGEVMINKQIWFAVADYKIVLDEKVKVVEIVDDYLKVEKC